jgi:hypothetical protein
MITHIECPFRISVSQEVLRESLGILQEPLSFWYDESTERKILMLNLSGVFYDT